MSRNRGIYAALIVITVVAGLSTRSLLRPLIGRFWAGNLGDALWALLVYLILVFIRPKLRPEAAAITTLLISTAVECSQLIQTPALNHWRRETIVGLAIGYGFSWGDLLAYASGIAVVCVCGPNIIATGFCAENATYPILCLQHELK